MTTITEIYHVNYSEEMTLLNQKVNVYLSRMRQACLSVSALSTSALSFDTIFKWGRILRTEWEHQNCLHINSSDMSSADRTISEKIYSLTGAISSLSLAIADLSIKQETFNTEIIEKISFIKRSILNNDEPAEIPDAVESIQTTTIPTFHESVFSSVDNTNSLSGCFYSYYMDHLWEQGVNRAEQNSRCE